MSKWNFSTRLMWLASQTNFNTPLPGNVVRIVLRSSHAYGQCTFTGLLDPLGFAKDLVVICPGRVTEHQNPDGELSYLWVAAGQPVWIPLDSILYVIVGDQS